MFAEWFDVVTPNLLAFPELGEAACKRVTRAISTATRTP
jgi:hypothetical protein